MPDDFGKQNPEKDSNSIENPKVKRISRVILIFIFGAVSAGFGAIGGLLFNVHPTPLLVALLCFFISSVFAAFVLRLVLINHRTKHRIPKWLPNGCCAGLIILGLGGCLLAWFLEGKEVKPHFTLSLKIGDNASSTLLLTNEYLFTAHFAKVADLNNGSFVFKGYVDGCLVIPVQPGKSNIVFNFGAENDSPVKVNDLEMAVAFPKDWAYLVDAKWHTVDVSWKVPGLWKFNITNLQFWAAQSPWGLFSGDSLQFPSITNSSIAAYNGPTSKGGFFGVTVRSTGFENTISANIIYFPVSSNFSKPFVTKGTFDSNGKLNFSFPLSQ